MPDNQADVINQAEPIHISSGLLLLILSYTFIPGIGVMVSEAILISSPCHE